VFERRCRCWFGRGDSGIRHTSQNSTRLARRSTNRAIAKQMTLRSSVRAAPC
jgi:hypothetical protein